MAETVIKSEQTKDYSWSFWPLVPLYPYGTRRTLRTEVIKDQIWTFDQLQGIVYVVVPIRMSVIKLKNGGLLIYAPIAPTKECINLVQELVAEHGEVKYIILPTISGLEHKVFVGPFARRFPQAEVFVAPNQWSFPVNLPLSWLGFPAQRTHILPSDSTLAPFASEFEYAILGPIELGPGRFEEVAFFHKTSQTLLVTDSVLSVPEDAPSIVQIDPYPLLFHAKDNAFDIVTDSTSCRRKGWQRICLFALYFKPSALNVVEMVQSIRDAQKAPQRSKQAYFGWYPFDWKNDWKQCFDALRGNGRLFVAPILQTLILNRAPQATIDWANKVASWNFQRIIACHFDCPINSSPQQFRQAFAFLEQHRVGTNKQHQPLPEVEFQLLQEIDQKLYKLKITPPPQPKI
ncbi:MAG: DUF4336 domain-containing protein [Coleofasciculaceae cyanobacterium]